MSDKLSALHDLLCDELLEQLKKRDPENPITPAMLNVIRQFLKDNNVDAIPATGSHLDGLIKELPPEFKIKRVV